MNRMKTTIEIPDALAQEAKEIALAQGATLRELVISGLRAEVERRSAPTTVQDFRLHTVTGRGLRPGVDPQRLTELAYE